MIRPHPNGFCYTSFEFESMKATMQSLKARGADGFVFGILNESEPGDCDPSRGWIDVSRNKQLVQLADGLPCTFHRAFDLIPESEWNFALSDIMDCGFTSILTSGGPSGTQATDCVHKLAILVDWNNKQIARAGKILKKKVPEIIVGGGVRATNIAQLRRITAASVFHSAALRVSSETVCTSEVSSMKEQLHRSLACT
jgi:copper homeostasis protein